MEKITNRMVELVKSEAARNRAQSRTATPFAADWAEVADALEAAAVALTHAMEEQRNANRRCS